MGITHYWEIRKTIEKDRFAKIAQDFKKTIPYLGVELAGWDGKGKPEITNNIIRFNGKEPHDYETFHFGRIAKWPHYSKSDRGTWFAFCKVGFDIPQPYDIAVKVALIIAKHHLGNDIILGSDETEAEWEDAYEIVKNVLGYEELKPKEEITG
ncbi:MAG: hypothetical protein RXR31_03385 [Thermoproteota archaeon]